MIISGNIAGQRVSSRELEERVQEAIKKGELDLTITAQGQQGIGGRIWPGQPVAITVSGPVGQRLGAMGMPGTTIVAEGGASDDVGWLNCGATITVLGDVTNGAHNAGAQGKLYVQGGGGARCDTMTKQNPRFPPLQSWYFRDVGDSFAEFKAGGIAVVCGVNPRHPENVLGYRPCVGMVGGTIYVRGQVRGYSEKDVTLESLSDPDWQWLQAEMVPFLTAIARLDFLPALTKDRGEWRKLVAIPAADRGRAKSRLSLRDFRRQHWEKEVGQGGLFGAMVNHPPFSLLPYITTGDQRRMRPLWQSGKKQPPCLAACPADIPSQLRFQLLRQGREAEGLQLVLQYSPFPASVCGSICPNMCMKACTRRPLDQPLEMKRLGQLGQATPAPAKLAASGKKVAVIGAGPAGLAAVWRLTLLGHQVTLYEAADRLGGKLWQAIEKGTLSRDVFLAELDRIKSLGLTVHPGKAVTTRIFEQILANHDAVMICCGSPGQEGLGLRFLSTDIACRQGKMEVNSDGQTTNPKVFAAGDVINRGLATHNIGQATRHAWALDRFLKGEPALPKVTPAVVAAKAINLDYYPPRLVRDPQSAQPLALQAEGERCLSCGLCRDCHICEASCPQQAIYREDDGVGGYRYLVDDERCIACGFCAAVCPCAVWEMELAANSGK